MKRNYFKYTAVIFVTFIIALILAKNNYVITKGQSVKLTIEKTDLTINATPLGNHDFNEEEVFENETEDETETTFNASLPVFNSSCDIVSLVFPSKNSRALSLNKSSFDVHHSLYLAICSFRI